jgi:hypothetical protein
MRTFVFCVVTATWTGISKLIDYFTHNFGLAFLGGACAAFLVLLVLSLHRAATLADIQRPRP